MSPFTTIYGVHFFYQAPYKLNLLLHKFEQRDLMKIFTDLW